MTAIEFIVDHQADILTAFRESTSANAAWLRLTESLPEIERQMGFATFWQYGTILVELNNNAGLNL